MDNEKKIVLWDIDDTLYDASAFKKLSRENSINAMHKALKKQGFAYDFDFLYNLFLEMYQKDKNSTHMFNDMLEKLVPLEHVPLYVAIAVNAYHGTKSHMRTRDGVDDALFKLSEMGFDMGIASSGFSTKQYDKVIRLGLMNYFPIQLIFITESVNPKELPFNKDVFFYAKIKNILENMGYKRIIMVGDKFEADIQPACGVGLEAILVNSPNINGNNNEIIQKMTQETSAIYADHIAQIPDLIEKNDKKKYQ